MGNELSYSNHHEKSVTSMYKHVLKVEAWHLDALSRNSSLKIIKKSKKRAFFGEKACTLDPISRKPLGVGLNAGTFAITTYKGSN